MPATDNFASFQDGLTSPAENAVAVTPHNSTDLAVASRALYIGGAGNISVETVGGQSAVVFAGISAGTILPIRVTRVNSTSTTATSIVAIY
jgi:hypothetical protein